MHARKNCNEMLVHDIDRDVPAKLHVLDIALSSGFRRSTLRVATDIPRLVYIICADDKVQWSNRVAVTLFGVPVYIYIYITFNVLFDDEII